MNNIERMNENTEPKKIGAAINQSIKLKYIGCLIFEYIPFVIRSPSYVSRVLIVNKAVRKIIIPIRNKNNPR
jgi:hypothetical protein